MRIIVTQKTEHCEKCCHGVNIHSSEHIQGFLTQFMMTLRTYLADRKISQREFVEMLRREGIKTSIGTINNYINNKATLRLDVAMKIHDLTDKKVSLKSLLKK